MNMGFLSIFLDLEFLLQNFKKHARVPLTDIFDVTGPYLDAIGIKDHSRR